MCDCSADYTIKVKVINLIVKRLQCLCQIVFFLYHNNYFLLYINKYHELCKSIRLLIKKIEKKTEVSHSQSLTNHYILGHLIYSTNPSAIYFDLDYSLRFFRKILSSLATPYCIYPFDLRHLRR